MSVRYCEGRPENAEAGLPGPGRPGDVPAGKGADFEKKALAPASSADDESLASTDFFDLALVGMAVTDRAGTIVRANPAYARITGQGACALVGKPWYGPWAPGNERWPEMDMAQLARRSTSSGGFERRLAHADGTVTWARVTVCGLVKPDGPTRAYLVQARDITELKSAEKAARHHKEQLGLAEQLVKLGTFQQSPDSQTFTASDGLHEILGVPAGSQVDMSTLMAIVHPEDREKLGSAIMSCMLASQPVDIVHRLLLDRDRTRWVRVQAVRALARDGSPGVVLGTVWDMTEVKLTEEALERQLSLDPLTGLPNRSMTAARLADMIDEAAETGGGLTVIMADVDRFKTVKDSLGHRAGDVVLRKLASRLREEVRPVDVVGHFFGDEFIVLCPGLSPPQADATATSIAQVFQRPLFVDGVSLHVTASVGYTRTGRGGTAEGAFRDAETAMYRAKRQGRGRVEAYGALARQEASHRLHVELALQEALVREELAVHYQPIVDLGTLQVVGVEALVRWESPEHGSVPPDEFVPIAEEAGLVKELGALVLKRVCEDQPRLVGPDDTLLVVGVNLSAHQLSDPALLEQVRATLESTSADPRYLTVEVCESAIMSNPQAALTTLQGLRDLGVRIALDDFGTGYSSLAYLKRYPIDIVKADRSFVAGLGRDVNDALIMSAIVNLAYTLDLEVVAEGVETTAQLAELRRIGCGRGQGFLWSRAVPLEHLSGVVSAIRPTSSPAPSDEGQPPPGRAPAPVAAKTPPERNAEGHKLGPQVRAQAPDLEVTHFFWRRRMHIGLAVGLVTSLSTCGYLLATPGHQNRLLLWAILGPSVPASVVLYWRPGLSLVKSSLMLPFSVGWSAFIVLVLAFEAWLDGGVSSPIICLVVIPVLFAGLAYPPVATAIVGLLADASYAVLAVDSKQPAESAIFGVALFMGGALMVVGSWARQVQDHRLYEMATRDGLTGCLTRTAFGEVLAAEVARAERFGRPLALLLADLDHLKEINDTQGHGAGDRALSGVGQALRRAARQLDSVGRVGGDEFAILLPETDARGAGLVLERVQATVRASAGPGVDVSLGYAVIHRRDTPETLLERADRSMYQAKANRKATSSGRP